jgi:tellurite resistance-related uncharacterized protein
MGHDGGWSTRAHRRELALSVLPDAVSPERRRRVPANGDLRRTTTPAALRARHTTKAGVWGEIVVVEGRVLYVIEDEKDASFVLRAGLSGPIAPGAPHHVEPYDDARFYVRFLR